MFVPIAAIAAAMKRLTVAGSADPDAIAYMDFTTGTYELDQVVRSLTDMLGDGLDISYISSRGMAIDEAGTNWPKFVGSLKTRFAGLLETGFTIVFDVENNNGWGYWLTITDTDNANTADDVLQLYFDGDVYDYRGMGIASSPSEFHLKGFNRFGFTMANDIGGGNYRYASSVNGSAALTDDEPFNLSYFGTPGQVALGGVEEWGYYLQNCWLRRVIIYPAMDETALAAKTAVSEDPGIPTLVGSDDVIPVVGTSIALDIPADVEDDDLLIACIYHRDTLTPPAGWTLVRSHSGTQASTLQYESVYARQAVAVDDAGATATWTQGSSLRCGGTLMAFRRADGAPLSVLSSGQSDLEAASAVVTATAYHQIAVVCAPFVSAATSPSTTGIILNTTGGNDWQQVTPAIADQNRHGVWWQAIELDFATYGDANSSVSTGSNQACSISLKIG